MRQWTSVSACLSTSFRNQSMSQGMHAIVHDELMLDGDAPKGLESNWIPASGKKPFPVMRFYGGTKEFWDKSWKMPDVELVE